MKLLLELISFDAYIFSIFYSLTFFIRTILFRKLYKITTTLNTESLENFYNNLIILIVSILFVEFIHRLFYYKSKQKIGNHIKILFKKSINKLIDHKIYCIKNYDKDQLYAINDLLYIFDSVYEKILLNCPRNIIYLIYYLYELYNFSLKTLIFINLISIISTYFLHYITILKESNYIEFYKIDINIKKKHVERLNNLKYIKTSLSENIEKNLVNELYETRQNLKNTDTKLSCILSGIPDLTGTIIIFVIYLIGASYIKIELLKPLDLIFFGSNSNNFIYYILDTKNIYDDYHKHWKQMELLFKIVNNRYYLEYANDKIIKSDYNISRICITHLLNKKYFNIEPGKITTITGKNGCGKTTMIYSMLGLTNINDWTFKFDYSKSDHKNINKSNLDHNIIRSCVGMVFQDPYLFDNTVWYNVKYNSSINNEEKIYKIADMIGLKLWLLENKNRNIGIN
jgi:ABC-type bacteriocin/lantibiotic exporter with double-glycine peptidase domain